MTDYSLKIFATTTAPARYVKDAGPKPLQPKNKADEYKTKLLNGARRKISNSVSSKGIDTELAYNGYNNLVKRVDNSKTKVKRENGLWGLGCTKRTITYYDKNGQFLFKRTIDEDEKIDKIFFKGANGNDTALYDNNGNGNFEMMEQRPARSTSRNYKWFDESDNKKGNYDAVTMYNSVPGADYSRTYDFNQRKVVHDCGHAYTERIKRSGT